MKQILRLGERYALSVIKRYVLYTLIISLYIILLPGSSAQAQSTSINNLGIPEGGLKIGDTIPEALWHLPLQVVNHPEGKDTITLNDYRGKKLIILDFWAYYCKPCVLSVEKLNQLDPQFSDEIACLTLNSFDSPDKAIAFMEKKNWTLITAIDKRDSVLKKSFYGVPRFGQVWIKDDRLYAFPKNNMLTTDILAKIVHDIPADIQMYYPEKP